VTTFSQLPNLTSKNVTVLHPLKRDMFVIMRSSTDRFYIGQVLDLYKRGANSRYGSVESASTAQCLSWLSLRVYLPLQLVLGSDDDEDEEENVPDFTCTLRTNKYHLHTHAPADHLICHLGTRNALLGDNLLRKSLSQLAASHWKAVQCTSLTRTSESCHLSRSVLFKLSLFIIWTDNAIKYLVVLGY